MRIRFAHGRINGNCSVSSKPSLSNDPFKAAAALSMRVAAKPPPLYGSNSGAAQAKCDAIVRALKPPAATSQGLQASTEPCCCTQLSRIGSQESSRFCGNIVPLHLWDHALQSAVTTYKIT